MDLQPITMSKGEARRRLAEYRAGLRRRADVEYAAAAEMYRALANGHPILELDRALRVAPTDAQGRPRLAIARADRKQVQLRWERGSFRALFDSGPNSSWDFGRWPQLVESVDMGRPPNGAINGRLEGYAMVPMVPPAARGAHALTMHHVLWEVELWADRPIGAQPDRDPYLLRRLHGNLWMVMAAWELTDVERAVMRVRASQP